MTTSLTSSSTLISRCQQLVSQANKFEHEAKSTLSNLSSVLATHEYSDKRLADNAMILHSGAPAVAKIMQNVDLLKKDFVRLEGKLPQLDEISERLENLSDLTLNEVEAFDAQSKMAKKRSAKELAADLSSKHFWILFTLLALWIAWMAR